MKKSKKYVVSIILNIVLFIGLIALMFHYGAFGSITSKLNNKTEKWEPSTYYQINTDVFNHIDSRGGTVLLGDSITALNEWQELYPDLDIKNRGIDGDTSEGVLNRLDDVIDLKPNKVFLMIGINDISQGIPVDKIGSNYEAIVSKLQSSLSNSEIFLMSVLPVNEDIYNESHEHEINNQNILDLNSKIENISQISGVKYINLYPNFVKENQMSGDYTRDGLHLNEEGYQNLEKLLEPYL